MTRTITFRNDIYLATPMQPKHLTQKILLPLLLLVSCGASAANSLHVAANQHHVITQASLSLDELVLDDGATVSFAPGLTQVFLRAARTRIGNHVHIVASGESGARGGDGRGFSDAAGRCEAGAKGGDGAAGHAGGDGIDVTLELGVVAIGDLRVEADGGNGGDGGGGGNGQRGGDIERCYGKDGGAGGNGGDGGHGGKGGAVTLRYWRADAALASAQLAQAMAVSVRGGHGGSGGKAGAGGDVPEGRYLSTAFGGGKKWLAPGQPGAAGSAGRAGAVGNAGAVSLMQQDATPASTPVAMPMPQAASAAATENPVSRAEFDALRLRVQQLEQRLRALPPAQP